MTDTFNGPTTETCRLTHTSNRSSTVCSPHHLLCQGQRETLSQPSLKWGCNHTPEFSSQVHEQKKSPAGTKAGRSRYVLQAAPTVQLEREKSQVAKLTLKSLWVSESHLEKVH